MRRKWKKIKECGRNEKSIEEREYIEICENFGVCGEKKGFIEKKKGILRVESLRCVFSGKVNFFENLSIFFVFCLVFGEYYKSLCLG